MQVTLKVLAGSQTGKEISIKNSKFLIGRSESCQLRPKSESISRKHCALVQKDGRLLALDLKSRNGTFVNDKELATNKAKILKDGDTLRVGQLEFQVMIEVGLGGAKKSVVKDVKEAAERMAQSANSGDSRYEEIDINSWLEEADQIDRGELDQDPETRQFNLKDAKDHSETMVGEKDETSLEVSGDDAPAGRPAKRPAMKLPKDTSKKIGNTKDAAQETLRKYFGGRG
jgi:pSer/pThr/pTyr-binding forkhead associated (FHA) protein